jgi:hypothetical protein
MLNQGAVEEDDEAGKAHQADDCAIDDRKQILGGIGGFMDELEAIGFIFLGISWNHALAECLDDKETGETAHSDENEDRGDSVHVEFS